MSMIETGWGNAVPDPMGAGAYAPGYGEWLREQAERDWDAWRVAMRFGRLRGLQRDIQILLAHLEWYRTASDGWHLKRLIPRTEAELHQKMASLARLVAGGDPYG